MNQINNLLLSSHGTAGAMAAERMALELCNTNSRLFHLLVVPDFWQHMMGDDWLNNGITRDRYARYLERELGYELDQNIQRIRNQAEEIGADYTCEIRIGDPGSVLNDCCNQNNFDLIVVGSPRPKGIPGLKSRMTTDKTLKSITIPLLIAPYPDE